jgi:hypothetical protein
MYGTEIDGAEMGEDSVFECMCRKEFKSNFWRKTCYFSGGLNWCRSWTVFTMYMYKSLTCQNYIM